MLPQQKQQKKRNLIFCDTEGLREVDQNTGLRDELVQGYNIMLPNDYQAKAKELNGGQMPNQQRVYEMLQNGDFGDGARMIDTSLNLWGMQAQQESKVEQEMRQNDQQVEPQWDPGRTRAFGMGEEMQECALNDGVISQSRYQQSVQYGQQGSKDNLNSFQREESWRSQIVKGKYKEVDEKRAKQQERLQHRGARVFDPSEIDLQPNQNNQPVQNNTFQKAQPSTQGKEKGQLQIGKSKEKGTEKEVSGL